MFEITLFKIDNGLQFKTGQGGGIVANIITGETAAIGFNLAADPQQQIFQSTDWSFSLKLANPSARDVALKDVVVQWIGRYPYYAVSSPWVSISCFPENSEKIEEYLPILIKAGAERKIRVAVRLSFFYRVLPLIKFKALFRRQDIVEPDTYGKLVRRFRIILKTNHGKLVIK